MSKQKPDSRPETDPAGADERNLVKKELDEALPPEEKLKQWWMKNRAALGIGAVLALVVVAGYQGIRLYRQAYEAKVQEAWLLVESAEDRKQFADEHTGHPLGGLAWFQLGDAAYAEGDFSNAQSYYERAQNSLAEPLFSGRAGIGAAVSAVKSGDREMGLQLLESIATDPSGYQSIRAEAAYHRAVLAIEDADAESFTRFQDLLMTLKHTQGWLSRLQNLQSQAGF